MKAVSDIANFAGVSAWEQRTRLTTNRIYYVRTDGNDANDGLTNTAGGAFRWPQKAYDTIVDTLDLAGFTVTIVVADGTYAPASGVPVLSAAKSWTGGGNVTITGNTTTPANVVWSTTNAHVVQCSTILPGLLTVQGMRFTSSGSGAGACVYHFGTGIIQVGAVDYGAVVAGWQHDIAAVSGGLIRHVANYSISAAPGGAHWWAQSGGAIIASFLTIKISTPITTGSVAFAYADRQGKIEVAGNTYTGSAATGPRYAVNSLGLIYTNGATLPGSSNGTPASGGQYV